MFGVVSAIVDLIENVVFFNLECHWTRPRSLCFASKKNHTHDTQEDDSKVGGNQKGVRHPSASYWVGVAVTSLPTIAFRSREQRARLLLYNNTDN
jgi:hypothetical protein